MFAYHAFHSYANLNLNRNDALSANKKRENSKVKLALVNCKKIPIFCLAEYAAEIHLPITIFS